MDVGNVEKT